jgi:hypothetical protein
MSMLSSPVQESAAALPTRWLDANGRWHASVVTPDGQRCEFLSHFELARRCRGIGAKTPTSGAGDAVAIRRGGATVAQRPPISVEAPHPETGEPR